MTDQEMLQAMAQMLAPIQVDISGIKGHLVQIDERLSGLETRMDGLETRMEGLETRMGAVETRLDGLETRMGAVETRLDGLETRMGAVETRLDGLETRMEGLEAYAKETRVLIETDIAGKIQLIYENQLQVIGEHKAIGALERRVEVLEDDAFALKETVRELKMAR